MCFSSTYHLCPGMNALDGRDLMVQTWAQEQEVAAGNGDDHCVEKVAILRLVFPLDTLINFMLLVRA